MKKKQPLAKPAPAFAGWFVLNVARKKERSVAKAIWRAAMMKDLEHKFKRTIIPSRIFRPDANNRKKIKTELKFPDYLMIQMVYDEETYNLIRTIKHCGGFTGYPEYGQALPMIDDDVWNLLKAEKESKQEKKIPKLIVVPFNVGDLVTVTEGAWKEQTGKILQIKHQLTFDDPSPKVTVEMTMWQRPVPIVLDWTMMKRST